jgi:hypothetical protein
MKTLFLFLISFTSLFSQNWQEMKGIFNPTGLEMKHFTAPFFFDYDNDGDKDLNLCYLGSNAKFYRNEPVNGLPHYIEDTVYLAQISVLSPNSSYSYAVFADLNNDGKIDLVTAGFSGLTCYYNLGSVAQPEWVKKDSVFQVVNTLIGSDAKPELGDLDGDGDLDLLVGIGESLLGGPPAGTTKGFRNVGTSSAPIFEEFTSFATGIPDVGLNAYPCLADMDNDGKLDLLMGRDLASFYYFKNNGTVNLPQWVNVASFISTETSHYWKNPDFVDIDNDGDFDLVYGTDDGNLITYQNNGTISAPVFAYNGSFFPVVKVPGHSTVSLADIDNDGDLDMVSGTSLGQVRLIKNNGTRMLPNFALTAGNLGNMSTSSYSVPKFADFNNDGFMDVVIGATDGKVYLYLQTINNFNLVNWFPTVDVGWSSFPAPVDLDGDGDMDLLVGGETSASVIFLENTGNNTFVTNQSFIAGINFGSYNRPSFGDVDNDGDYDLVIGSLWGSMKFYENTGTSTVPVWTERNSLVAGMDRDQNSSPFFADIDGDTRKDLIIGDSDGNFVAYKNLFSPVSVEVTENIPLTFQLSNAFPNPFNPATIIRYALPIAGDVTLKVYDIHGQLIETLVSSYQESGNYEVTFPKENKNLASGLFLYELQAGGARIVKKMIMVK